MSSRQRVSIASTKGTPADQESAQKCVLSEDSESFQPERMDRIAPLIALGQIRFPSNLAPEAANRLVREVQQLRRKQLVRFVAAQIAQAVLADKGPPIKERN